MVVRNKLLAYTAICSIALSSMANASELERNTAKMQAMDKITGRVSVIEVPVGGEVAFGSFSIVVRSCKTTPPEETPENHAFVDVADSSFGKMQFNIFKGWMMSSSPALNAVEHPIYDVWLLKCLDTNVDKSKLLSSEKIQEREGLPKLADIKQESTSENAETTQMTDIKNMASPVAEPEKLPETVLDSPLNPAPAQESDIVPEVLPEAESGPKSLLNIADTSSAAPITTETETLNVDVITELSDDTQPKPEEVIAPLLLTPPEVPSIPSVDTPVNETSDVTMVESETVETPTISEPTTPAEGNSVESLPEDDEDQFIDLSTEADSTAALEAELSAEALKDK